MTAQPMNQGELFVLDSPLLTEVRGEPSLMAYPFFALTKTAWKRSLIYKTDAPSIEIGPGPRGVATIYDKEVLLYIASLMVAKLDAGEHVSQDFFFTAHDLFRVTGVNGSARSYSRLSDALERLQGTQIKTNIEAGGEGQAGEEQDRRDEEADRRGHMDLRVERRPQHGQQGGPGRPPVLQSGQRQQRQGKRPPRPPWSSRLAQHRPPPPPPPQGPPRPPLPSRAPRASSTYSVSASVLYT